MYGNRMNTSQAKSSDTVTKYALYGDIQSLLIFVMKLVRNIF